MFQQFSNRVPVLDLIIEGNGLVDLFDGFSEAILRGNPRIVGNVLKVFGSVGVFFTALSGRNRDIDKGGRFFLSLSGLSEPKIVIMPGLEFSESTRLAGSGGCIGGSHTVRRL